ncbi:MAG: butyrate kinase [bacterium]
MKKILVINPGSTSTKFAVYHNEEPIFEKTLRHQGEELAPFATIASQYAFRKETILNALEAEGIEIAFDIVVGRGGLLHPLPSGVYEVNDLMRETLLSAKYGEHACNLGGLIAADIAKSVGCMAVIADPVVVDEMQDVARISGHPEVPNISIFHALNQKAIARRYAAEVGRDYAELNLIVAHLGGGISVGAHRQGKVVDVNCALGGNGAFSPERVGTLSASGLMKLCFSGKYTEQEVKKMLIGNGGLMAHLGVNDAYQVELRALAGDEKAALVYNAMAYSIAKEIGAMAAVLKGNIDGILITGGIAYDKAFVAYMSEMVGFMAPIKVYPGEDELGALASNGLRVLNGEPCAQYEA